MKYLVRAIVGALICFCATVLIGAVCGGVFRLAPCYGGFSSRSLGEQIVYGTRFGAFAFAVLFGLPAALVGALTGPLVEWVLSRRQRARRQALNDME